MPAQDNNAAEVAGPGATDGLGKVPEKKISRAWCLRTGPRACRVILSGPDQGQIKAASVLKSGAACQPGMAICAFRWL
jgi:hypothetical protein